MAKNPFRFLRKNLIPVLIVLAIVGLVIYLTQKKEGFGYLDTCNVKSVGFCPVNFIYNIEKDKCERVTYCENDYSYYSGINKCQRKVNGKVISVNAKRRTIQQAYSCPEGYTRTSNFECSKKGRFVCNDTQGLVGNQCWQCPTDFTLVRSEDNRNNRCESKEIDKTQTSPTITAASCVA